MNNALHHQSALCKTKQRLTRWAFVAVVMLPAVAQTHWAIAQQQTIAWPAAPESEPALLKKRPTRGNPPLLQIEAPVPGPPPNDLLQEIASDSSPFRGKFVYAPLLKLNENPVSQHFFVLRGVGVKGLLGDQTTSTATYHMESYGVVYDPQFSSDGSRILFKVGWPFDSTGSYDLYLWDTAARQLQRVKVSSSYDEFWWSPDNNYIAYIRGGDKVGSVWGMLENLQLRVKDLRTGKDRRIAKNPGVTEVAWTHQGTLLLTLRPKTPKMKKEEEEEEKKDPNSKAQDSEPEAPLQASIYETPATGGPTRRIVENGYNPVPSPNGKWIAFFRQPDVKGVPVANAPPQVYLYDRLRKESVLVGSWASWQTGFMRWTPDSRSLIVTEVNYRTAEDGISQGAAHVNLVNPSTQAIKKIAVLEAQDLVPTSGFSPRFAPLKFSNDSRFLFVSVTELTGKSKSVFHTKRRTLRAVNLYNGNVSVVARVEDPFERVIGFDWHDESGSTGSTSSSSLRLRRRSK